MAVLSCNTVRTRKPHLCCGCQTVYPAKTEMKVQSIADDGTVYRVYMCGVCYEVMQRTCEPGDTWNEGNLKNGDPEYWEEVKGELERGVERL